MAVKARDWSMSLTAIVPPCLTSGKASGKEVLPVQSMEPVHEIAEGGKLAKAAKAAAGDVPKVGDMHEPLLPFNQPQSTQHLEAEMFLILSLNSEAPKLTVV
ncbi:hypothetical protein KEM48_013065 [Puccinia striiformis f. sp. tritici PST-130]|uniref:Uncharacterized protein n=1 Tax=Puccinia striiformis f. sp. tritici PST-78 TaxID=1165861 RepID=A0A0L0VV40_9BASI|nr:hypothetical protein KEM48_013065 [Puccinia striiformis f. sp. tritici PST-130]KNF03143.1 hypothetical protein PSTG_03728 [Puccinia striiformis f. sp. tritici PST-78]